MKKIIIGSAIILGLATGFAYAHGNNWGGNHMMGGSHYGMMGGNHMMGGGFMGPQMMGGRNFDCPGASGWTGSSSLNEQQYQEFYDKTSDIRKQMNDVRFDYMEAYRNPNTNKETISDLEQKMTELRSQMYEIHKQFRAE